MRGFGLVVAGLALSLTGRASLANGGGYAFGVKFTGAVAPFQASGTENVRIIEEKLKIDLRRTEAAVIVNYTMRNQSKEPAKVTFGFPAEAQKDDDFEEDEGEQPTPGDEAGGKEQRRRFAAIQQLKGYSVRMNGHAVKAEFQVEPFASGTIQPFPGSDALKSVAGWMVSEVLFPAAASSVLEIRYTADYQGDVTSVSNDYENSPLAFHYRLSTGAVWNGTIETGSVTLKADGIPSSEVEILKPDGRFKRSGDEWVWRFSDLEPTLADDISVNAVPGWVGFDSGSWDAEASDSGHAYVQHLDRWGEGHQKFTAVASSSLKSKEGRFYGPENLATRITLNTLASPPWCEGVAGSGVGEYVELKTLEPKPLMAVGVYSGFQSWSESRKDLFARNARPSRIEIVLNGDHRIRVTLGDTEGEQLISLSDYTKPVSKVRLIVKDAYSGTHYQDTCISKVVLYDSLARKPEVRPAR